MPPQNFLNSEEKLVTGDGNDGRDSRDSLRSVPGVRPRQACLTLPAMLHQPPVPGLVPGGDPGGTGHLVYPWTSLLRVLRPWRLSPMALVTALSSVTAPSAPALDPTAPSQPGHRGRGQPGQGRPRSLSGADGSGVGRTEAAQRVLPFMHTQRDSRRLRLPREVPLGPALAVHFTRVQRA